MLRKPPRVKRNVDSITKMIDLEISIRRSTGRVWLPLTLFLVFISKMVGLETKSRISNFSCVRGDDTFNEQSVLLQHKVT